MTAGTRTRTNRVEACCATIDTTITCVRGPDGMGDPRTEGFSQAFASVNRTSGEIRTLNPFGRQVLSLVRMPFRHRCV